MLQGPPLEGGITKDSPEHGRTVLVDIYRLQCWVAYGGVKGFPAENKILPIEAPKPMEGSVVLVAWPLPPPNATYVLCANWF